MFSDSQAVIRWMAHLDTEQGQQLATAINEQERALWAHGIEAGVYWVPARLGVPGNDDADPLANKTRQDRGYTVHERMYTLAANVARQITEGRTVGKADW